MVVGLYMCEICDRFNVEEGSKLSTNKWKLENIEINWMFKCQRSRCWCQILQYLQNDLHSPSFNIVNFFNKKSNICLKGFMVV